ncbi:MAG: SDR family NAD(P)-dependent oxidoreductase [Proteobacteria bacterium]|nr:SDR family NAD(P)-dependent oxidoreductase [Pseudomonadota bacterium]
MKINGTTVLVTGGASGLGEACVRCFASEGANVAIFDMNSDAGEALAKEIGKQAIFITTDVSDEKNVQASVDATMTAFGSIHGAINCAGIVIPSKVLVKGEPSPMAGFIKTIQVNLLGTMNVIRLASAKMLLNPGNEDGEKGIVINTASIAAFEGQIGQASYTASKAAIVGMTLPIAREFADYGIRVNTIAPGLFETPMMAGLPEKVKASLAQMVPFPKRLGKPSEFALLAKHIMENPVMNGETIRLDSAVRMSGR